MSTVYTDMCKNSKIIGINEKTIMSAKQGICVIIGVKTGMATKCTV